MSLELADKTQTSTTSSQSTEQAKHAYLVMAHHKPELLQLLLDALDDERNDIFVHIDKKSQDFMPKDQFRTSKSALVCIPSMEVNWAGYSQIQCELNLLKAAVNHGEYQYFHLMTGASYPLKSQNYIHEFFEHNAGREFIDFTRVDKTALLRVTKVWYFNEIGKMPFNFIPDNRYIPTDVSRNVRNKLLFRNLWVNTQAKLHYDRLRIRGYEPKKGLAYWSITQDFARYIVKHEKLIKKLFAHSVGGDEFFIQTMVFNSPFKNNVFSYLPGGCMRTSTWDLEEAGHARCDHNFNKSDIDYLLNSSDLFALKFESDDGVEIIEAIRDSIMKELA